VLALIPSALVALAFAFIPALGVFASFSWFIAAGLGFVTYYAVADRSREFVDMDGEAIAVETKH
jgi:NCS1 family nucleobase:cation symporter-1